MGRAAKLNAATTVAQRDGISLKADGSGYALFIPQGEDPIKPRAIADSFGFRRHELGAPELDIAKNGVLIPICPRVAYSCCPEKSMQWSDALEDGFGPSCPEHGGRIEFIYEQEEAKEPS